MKFIQIAKMLITFMPALIEAVKMVEAAFPGGSGAEKLAVVRGVIEAAYTAADEAFTRFNDIWPAFQTVINTLVAAYNALGIFKRANHA